MKRSVVTDNMLNYNFKKSIAVFSLIALCGLYLCSCNVQKSTASENPNEESVTASDNDVSYASLDNSHSESTFSESDSTDFGFILERENDSNSNEDDTKGQSDPGQIVELYTNSNTNVRYEPSETAEIYCELETGSLVTVISKADGWCTVLLDGKLLYIDEAYLDSETVNKESEQSDIVSSDKDSDNNFVAEANGDKKLIVIDAGHQQTSDLSEEPIAPGATETKAKVTGGTSGCVSGLAEYELTLQLSLQLQEVLEERGYEVIQVRTENDVNISNIERADVANNANADAFIRVHANGSEDSSVNGAMTLCQTAYNPYNGDIYEECKALSTYVLDELVAATGCNKQYVWETDTMCGINWSRVPVTIVEVGYMTNPEEDLLMADENYQEKIATGIANGIDEFLEVYGN